MTTGMTSGRGPACAPESGPSRSRPHAAAANSRVAEQIKWLVCRTVVKLRCPRLVHEPGEQLERLDWRECVGVDIPEFRQDRVLSCEERQLSCG